MKADLKWQFEKGEAQPWQQFKSDTEALVSLELHIISFNIKL